MVFALGNQPKAQSFDEGLASFRGGEFAAALAQLLPLAKRGHAGAQFNLGLAHEYGRGVKSNDVNAANWYNKAAKQEHAGAQYRLAVLHDNGWGVAKDHPKAVYWYKIAAEQGHALAQHDLALMYFRGTGVPRNLVRAYMWLRIAVAQGSGLMEKHLNRVAGHLSPHQRQEAEFLARQWMRTRIR